MISIEKVIDRVERKVDHGQNHFTAYGGMASVALFLTRAEEVRLISDEVNEAIVDLLEERELEGVVYTIPQYTGQSAGNSPEEGGELVFVAERNGVPTGALPRYWQGRNVMRVPLAATSGFTGPLMDDFLRRG